MRRSFMIKAGNIVSIGIDTDKVIPNDEREALMSHLLASLKDHDYQFITNYSFSIEVETK